MEVYKAIAAITADLAKVGIAKTDENKFDGYKYRGIDSVYNALASRLANHLLCVLPRVLSRDVVERTSSKGGQLIHTTLDVEFDLVSAVDGSKHTIRAIGEAQDRSDKSVNKAMTAAYKYAMFQLFCIPTEGDDADADSYEIEPNHVEIAEKFSKEISTADKAKLKEIADSLSKANLPVKLLQPLRDAWAARNKELQKPKDA